MTDLHQPKDDNPLNVPINTPQPIHVKLDGDYEEMRDIICDFLREANGS